MAAWVTETEPEVLFDPAVGPGTFFLAANDTGFRGSFAGFELDNSILESDCSFGLSPARLLGVRVGDFLKCGIDERYSAIISNPPYIRHHRLGVNQKREGFASLQPIASDFRWTAGRLHAYFLLKCLEHLAPNGRLVFLLPADVCEGVSSSAFWNRLASRFHIDAVLTFDENAAPFPSVDTNVIVFMLSHRTPAQKVLWARIHQPATEAVFAALRCKSSEAATVHQRELGELLATGLSRPPKANGSNGIPLSAFARIMRGIATGANEFFFLTAEQIRQHSLDCKFFKRAIGRTRDCPNDVLTHDDLESLDKAGRPTWLLSVGRERKEDLPKSLRDYLDSGERLGLDKKSLIGMRRPWYRMEERGGAEFSFRVFGQTGLSFH